MTAGRPGGERPATRPSEAGGSPRLQARPRGTIKTPIGGLSDSAPAGTAISAGTAMPASSATPAATAPRGPLAEQRAGAAGRAAIRVRRPATQSSDRSFIPPEARARIRAAATPIALAAGRSGLSPDALTVVGFGIAAIAAAAAAAQLWLPAGLLVIFGGAFDLLDGGLARAQNRATRFGAFLDSTMDRWGEGVVYAGIVGGAAAAGSPVLAALSTAAAVSSFQVSYTRAKAESLGLHGEVGVAPRAERLVVLTVGLVLAGLDGGVKVGARGQIWLGLALGLIFVLASVTALQRTWHVRRQLRDELPAGPVAVARPDRRPGRPRPEGAPIDPREPRTHRGPAPERRLDAQPERERRAERPSDGRTRG